ncbi:MAG TPA: fibronectin type III domain-containing protein [Candidatus Methanofastidiosa archaeon]|nr:fibronectin type III domain-containing protein [Candidatus Methanofastidiosa archaeon]
MIKDAATGTGISGANVTITNLDTGEFFQGVSGAGGYMVGQNLTQGVSEGDTIRAVATEGTGTGTLEHVVTAAEEAGGGTTMNVDIMYPLSVTLNVVEDQCAHTAVFTAVVTGGDGQYTYDWTKAGTGDIQSGGGAGDSTMTIWGIAVSGTVTVEVTDNSSNVEEDSNTYSLNGFLRAEGSWDADCDGNVLFSISVTGGSPPYTYEFDTNNDGTVDDTQTTSNLSASVLTSPGMDASGTWSWTVTDVCSTEENGAPEAWETPSELTVEWSSTVINHCTGEVYLEILPTGGTAPYQYDWDTNGDGTFETNGEEDETVVVGYGASGTISVRVTDACSNTATKDFNYTTNAELAVDITNASMSCDHTSVEFTAQATGGSGNYTYTWDTDGDGEYDDDTGATTTITPGVDQQGTVYVKVVDAEEGGLDRAINDGCVAYAEENYDTTYVALDATGSWQAECDGTVTFTIEVTGGTTEYTYEIDANNDGTIDRTYVTSDTTYGWNFNPGWGSSMQWSWKVTDNCSSTVEGQPETWTVPNELDVQFTSTDEDHCSGEVTLTAEATGGTPPYQYDWDADGDGTYEIVDGGATRTFDVGFDASGRINVRVTDQCTNNATEQFSYDINPELTVEITSVEVSCNHETVTFTATAQGGSGDYTYVWDIDGDGYDDGNTNQKVINPGINQQGTVFVKVIDNTTGCEDVDDSGYDTSYTPLQGTGNWDWNCDGDLVLTIDVTGGTPNYTYEFDYDNDGNVDYTTTTPNTSVQHVFDTDWEDNGQWSWNVADNCSETSNGGPAAWAIPAQLAITDLDLTIDHCSGMATWVVTASGGGGTYAYDWDMDGDAAYEVVNGGNTQSIIGYGIQGTINVKVRDTTHGCFVTENSAYDINPELIVTLQVVVDQCASTATFTAVAVGGTGDGTYTFDWDMNNDGTYEILDGGTQQIIAGPDQNGTVKVRVNDDFCTDTDTENYDINPLLSLDLNVNYGDGVAIITAEGNGGGENYIYDWDMNNDGTYEILDGGQEQRVHGYEKQGTVNVRATDACLDQVEGTVEYAIPEEVVVNPPTEILIKGIYELDEVTPHDGSASYIVMWYPDNDADWYLLQESLDPDFNTVVEQFITQNPRKKFSNMVDGIYYYRIQGCNDAGCTPWSDTMTAMVGDVEIVPNPPTTLTANALSTTSIELAWNDNADNEDGFKVFRNGTLIATLPANTTSYTDEGLECGTSYTYYVMSYNDVGNSAASNMATGVTEECSPEPTAPNTPTGLNADATSQSSVEVSWTDASNNETGFKLYRDGTLIATLSSNTTEYTDAGLECDTSHSYYVVAYNNYGQSESSNSDIATTYDCDVTTTTPPASDIFVQATLMSPAYLHALDAEGRHIGRISSEEVEIEIPGGTYSGIDSHPQVITVYNPQSEIQFYFEAYDEGTVTLNVETSENGINETYSFKDLSVQDGSVFLVNAGSNNGQLDIDGDGMYEQEIAGVLIQDDESEGGSNAMMYIALVIVVVLIAAAVLYLQSNKKE